MGKKKCLIIIGICFLALMMFPLRIEAASYIKINMNGKVLHYEGTQVKVRYQGHYLDLAKTPGIVINNIALLPYVDVFQKGLGGSCSFSSKTKQVRIQKNGVTVCMTAGSTIAYINGRRTTVSVAPREVYYHASKVTKLLVPSRFVAEALGYDYNWNSKLSSVEITDPYSLYFNKKWHVYNGTKGHVTIDGTAVNVEDLPTIVMNNTALVQAKKVFGDKLLPSQYTHNTKSKTITICNDDNKVRFTLDSTTAYVNGKKHKLTVAPKLVKDNVSRKSYVMVPAKFTAQALGFVYNWNSATKTSEITVAKWRIWSWKGKKTNESSACTNTLTSIALEYTKEEEYMRFVGIAPLDVQTVFSEKTNTITVIIADLNNVSTMLKNTKLESDNVSLIHISECETGSLTVTIHLTEETAYYEALSGNQYDIHFCRPEVDVDLKEDTILLPLPDGVSFSELQDEDCYYDNEFKIKMEGTHTSYFTQIPDTLPNGIKSVKCSLDSKKNTVLTFYTTKVQGYKLIDYGDTFGVKVGNPKDIYKSIVLLDAGHGGTDPGCVSNGHKEKDINFNIIYRFCKQYFSEKSSPVKAYWTRTTDTKTGLNERASYAKKVGADIFISLHMNSAGQSAANGTETYYCLTNNEKNSYGLTSKTLANYFQYKWSPSLGLSTSRGVKTANYVVIKKNTIPAILIELGFMTGSKDITVIGSTTYQKKAAKSFYQTVCSFFEVYPTGR